MKNLNSARLKRYRVEPPIGTAVGFGTFFPGSKVYTFEFPKEEKVILKSIVSEISFMGIESIRVSMSIQNSEKQIMYTVGTNEVYELQEYLQREGECFVWQYSQELHAMRVSGMKSLEGIDFDLRHSAVQVVQYNGEMPPLKQAYATKMYKNGEYTYAKGTVGKWQFVHLKADLEFPWETLHNISDQLFKNNLVQVFFNEETKKHLGEFVLWYNPSVMPII